MQREASDSYIPAGYILEDNDIFTLGPEVGPDLESHISQLIGLWKYSAIGLFTKEGRKHRDEYTLVLIKMWDTLDKLPVDTVESIAVELNGQILGDDNPDKKGILTNIEDYLKVRAEQDQ